MRPQEVLSDINAVKLLAKKHIYLNTISWEYLDQFGDLIKVNENTKYTTIRARFRKALNECASQGIAKKSYQGSTIYETGDTLGGKVYIDYNFKEWVSKNLD
jgi:hypothetical protein